MLWHTGYKMNISERVAQTFLEKVMSKRMCVRMYEDVFVLSNMSVCQL